MPGYKTHLTFGVICGIVFVYVMQLSSIAMMAGAICLAGFGSLFPDVDHQQSKINNMIEFGLAITVVASIAYYYVRGADTLLPLAGFAGVFAAGIQLLHHRGFFHEWWFGIAVAIPLFAVNVVFGAAFVVGFFSHLFADKYF